MSFYTSLVRPLFFRFDPEFMHGTALTFGRTLGSAGWLQAWMRRQFAFRGARLATEVCGIRFHNPLGLAAGWDKSGQAVEFAAALGFGHVEIGSVSDGNPRPRLWRLPEDRALVVHSTKGCANCWNATDSSPSPMRSGRWSSSLARFLLVCFLFDLLPADPLLR